MKEISDSTPEMERMIEAVCPPKGTSLKEPIPAHILQINCNDVATAILSFGSVKQCAVKIYKKRVIAYVIADVEYEKPGIPPPV